MTYTPTKEELEGVADWLQEITNETVMVADEENPTIELYEVAHLRLANDCAHASNLLRMLARKLGAEERADASVKSMLRGMRTKKPKKAAIKKPA